MKKNILPLTTGFVLLSVMLLAGCATKPNAAAMQPIAPSITLISQIDSFNTLNASQQALQVVENNQYDQDFFTRVFARLMEQCLNSKSPDNAGIIWENFVAPLKNNGKVPPDLATNTWNGYFSRQFVSLPAVSAASHYCQRLPDIKVNIEKEYELKKAGFEITEQGSPDGHFLNAMYVYNTMWASCSQQD